jgi:hypothetical protein
MIEIVRSGRDLDSVYKDEGEGAIAVRFPLASGEWTREQHDVFNALRDNQDGLKGWATSGGRGTPQNRPRTAAPHPAGSLEVQKVLYDALHGRKGWTFEQPGSAASIPQPEGYGFNMSEIGHFHPDGWHADTGTVIEVEGAAAVENGNVLKRLARYGHLQHIWNFVAVAPMRYFKAGGGHYPKRPFEHAISHDDEDLALRGFETYMVIGIGGLSPLLAP